MNADLHAQLAAYGEVFAADLGTMTVEDVMTNKIGEGQVKALEPVPRRDQEKTRRRGIWLAAAVFLLVVAAGIAMLVALRGTSDVADTPAPPFDNGEDALSAYVAAEESGDLVAFEALWTDDAYTPQGDRRYTSDARFAERFRFRHAMVGFEPTMGGPLPEPAVECSGGNLGAYSCKLLDVDSFEWKVINTVSSDRSHIIDYLTRDVGLRVDEEGRIRNLAFSSTTDATFDPVFDDYESWLEDTHPDVVDAFDTLTTTESPLPMEPEAVAEAIYTLFDEYWAQR